MLAVGNQKRPLGKLGLGVLCSLLESYMMLPFLTFPACSPDNLQP